MIFKNFIKEFISNTFSGLESFNGPLGKLLSKKVWMLPVEDNFETIPCPDFPEIPDSVLKKLNNDAKTLYLLCKVVISGMS